MGNITMNGMTEKYSNLEKKEKKALQLGLVSILLFIIYQFIFMPFTLSLNSIKKQSAYQSTLNLWLKSNIPQTLTNKKANKLTLTSSDLLSNTDNSIKTSLLSSFSYQLSQTDPKSVLLTFKKAPYVDYMTWLEDFFKARSLSIKEITLTQTKEPGMVSTHLHFELIEA